MWGKVDFFCHFCICGVLRRNQTPFLTAQSYGKDPISSGKVREKPQKRPKNSPKTRFAQAFYRCTRFQALFAPFFAKNARLLTIHPLIPYAIQNSTGKLCSFPRKNLYSIRKKNTQITAKNTKKGPFYSVKSDHLPVFFEKGLKKSIQHKEWGPESILAKILVLYRFFTPPPPKSISDQFFLVAPRHFQRCFNPKKAFCCLRKHLHFPGSFLRLFLGLKIGVLMLYRFPRIPPKTPFKRPKKRGQKSTLSKNTPKNASI